MRGVASVCLATGRMIKMEMKFYLKVPLVDRQTMRYGKPISVHFKVSRATKIHMERKTRKTLKLLDAETHHETGAV